jgi:Na+/proline symporter
MAGSIGAAYYLVNLPEIGGMANLIANENITEKLSIIPNFDDPDVYIPLLIVPLAVQWWSSWYPGAEPGGGGYIAQRMLAAKDESHAIGATFFFNVMHYALRPWPWIIVALASLVIFPDLASIQDAFPDISEDKLGHDLAYPAMLTMLPSGLLGLVVASLGAAYMSTISTHLNWGSSYIVNDFYKQQIKKNASEKELVNIGRISTVSLFVISAIFALLLTNALQLFDVILMFGAGTGLIFILRWFWWRINAWSEISAMFVSGFISIILNFTSLGEILFSDSGILPSYYKFPMVVLFTSVVWLVVTFLTKPDTTETLINFCKKTNPGGPGWEKIKSEALKKNINFNKENNNETWSVPIGIICMLSGCFAIYSILFSTGYFLYGEINNGISFLAIGLIFSYLLKNSWKKLKKLK